MERTTKIRRVLRRKIADRPVLVVEEVGFYDGDDQDELEVAALALYEANGTIVEWCWAAEKPSWYDDLVLAIKSDSVDGFRRKHPDILGETGAPEGRPEVVRIELVEDPPVDTVVITPRGTSAGASFTMSIASVAHAEARELEEYEWRVEKPPYYEEMKVAYASLPDGDPELALGPSGTAIRFHYEGRQTDALDAFKQKYPGVFREAVQIPKSAWGRTSQNLSGGKFSVGIMSVEYRRTVQMLGIHQH